MSIGMRSDTEIRHDVIDALKSDIRVDATEINIEVTAGIVTLKGRIPSLWQKRTAWEITNRIKGVISIVNELHVKPERVRNDEQIREDVLRALNRDIWVDESKINVIAEEGKVTLMGIVDSYTEKSYAEDDAWSVAGVIEVDNQMVIEPKVGRTDEDIATDVRDDLIRNIRIDPTKISIHVTAGVVYLRGSVSTVAQKWLADDVAWWTPGVKDVQNELHVVL